MLILLSPSKTLDFESKYRIPKGQDPVFINDSQKLIKALRKFKVQDLADLMNISYKLASLNLMRYQEWDYPYDETKSRPALAAFKGDVYLGLKAWELNDDQITKADEIIRIISGLYGILKPTSNILPYRLEMGTQLRVNRHQTLYEFWGNKLTQYLKTELKNKGSNVLVNLASAEYFKAIEYDKLKVRIITPFFQEFSNGEYMFISTIGKKARGLMTRYIIDNNIEDPEDIKGFNYENYSFNYQKSDNTRWVFTR